MNDCRCYTMDALTERYRAAWRWVARGNVFIGFGVEVRE